MTEVSPAAAPAATPPASPPYSVAELRQVLYLPHRAIDVILTDRSRWLSTVTGGQQAPLLLGVMLLSAGLYAVPYAAVLNGGRLWHIGALYAGSAAICYPSLHVFSAFLGVRLQPAQSLALSMLSATVASIFSFGFFPVLWFLSATMSEASSAGSVQTISAVLLTVSLCAGLLQLGRCLKHLRQVVGGRSWSVLIIFWQALLVFITYRMGLSLGVI